MTEEAQKRMLAEVLGKIERLDISIDHTKDLIQIVARGVDEGFDKQPGQDDLLKAFQQMRMIKQKPDTKADLKHKLKLSIPLIPTILKYEAELSTDLRKSLKQLWKKASLRRIFLE